MRQLIPFDTSKGGTVPNYCLRNVRLGYGIAPLYNTAWEAWQNTQQHTGTPPLGVDVPLYFSYFATIDNSYKNWGHIGVQLKDGRFWSDGKIYSSYIAYTSTHKPKYVGWGESVNNVKVIEGGSEIMDTDAKVQAQYYTLRGNVGTAEERKHWIGKSYEEFNSVAKAEVNARTQNITNLTTAVATLTGERDAARAQVATLTKELLAERDKVQVLQSQVNTLQAELDGAKQAYKELEAQNAIKIAELNKVIEIKDNEIKRLTTELANCDSTLSWSQHLVLGLKGLLSALNPLSK
jgi:uncharacterized small protein (DUF1192 family)